jgi:hypothetical protein
MPDWAPSLVVGAVLVVLAAGLGWRQWTIWKAGPAGMPLEDSTRKQAWRQLRRRLQVSLVMGLVGVMIPMGDMLPVFRKSPRLFVIYWLVVLAAVVWIVLLALGDLASNLAFSRVARNQLRRERESLESALRQYRTQSNGKHTDEPR